MKYLLLVNLLFISCYPVKKQTVTIKAPLKEISLNKNDLFIVCRGTYSKSILIAQNFNIKDSNITHCGIGFIKNDVFRIYNVSDINSKKSCLIIDSLNSFRKSSDVYYLSIWKCKVDAGTLKAIKRKCEDYYRKKIDFDYSFTLGNDNTLYCSEFCSRILNDANNRKFYFKPLELHLKNEFYETILKRKVLIYFPVDFFEENKEFKKIYEWESSK
ncbi:MAG: hypothetical protein IPP72_15095 [Chitinophagaceae bacterium]|nr:hypothetical protein [Chitinophagaceae bacterium]